MNLYSMLSAMRYNTVAMASCAVTVSTLLTVIGLMHPVLLTLTLSILIAIIVMLLMMDPQIPSKNAMRNSVRKEKLSEVD